MVEIQHSLLPPLILTIRNLTASLLTTYSSPSSKTLQDASSKLEDLLEQLQSALHEHRLDVVQKSSVPGIDSIHRELEDLIRGHLVKAQEVLEDVVGDQATKEDEWVEVPPKEGKAVKVEKEEKEEKDVERAVVAVGLCYTYVSLALCEIPNVKRAPAAAGSVTAQHLAELEEDDPFIDVGTDTDLSVIGEGTGTSIAASVEALANIAPLTRTPSCLHEPGCPHHEKLSPMNYWQNQEDVISRRQKGTGEWILEDKVFQDWVGGKIHTCYLHGPPGAGKTVMAAIVNEHLHELSKTEDIGYSYAFLDDKQPDRTPEALAGQLTWKLHQNTPRPGTPQILTDFHDNPEGAKLEDVFTLLESMIYHYSRVFLVIDGLDEWPKRGEGYWFLRQTQLKKLLATGKLGLLVTSRKPALAGLDSERRGVIQVPPSTADIKISVKSRIEENPALVEYIGADRLESVVDEIVEKAGGMFLLAHLHLAFLATQIDLVGIEEALPLLAESLDSPTANILDGLQAHDVGNAQLVKVVLLCIAYSTVPMTFQEIIDTITTLSERNVETGPAAVSMAVNAALASGLAHVDHHGGGYIRLSHKTIQESIEANPGGRFSEAHSSFAAGCLSYLSLKVMPRATCLTWKEAQYELGSDRVLAYAVSNWAKHAREVEQGDEVVYERVLELVKQKHLVSSVIHLMQKYPDVSLPSLPVESCSSCHFKHLDSPNPQAGHREAIISASFGFVRVLEAVRVAYALSLEDIATGIRNGEEQTLLSIAAGKGQPAMVEWLLNQYPVHINQTDEYGNTALARAAGGGHTDVVRVLLARNGINPNSTDRLEKTALFHAVSKGHEEIVRLLLARTDINPNLGESMGHDQPKKTPLLCAVENGQGAIVGLLLEKGDVNPNLGDGMGTPLVAAVRDENLELVGALLRRGDVDPNLGKPLVLARRGGKEEVVRLLLERSDINRDPEE